MTTKEQKVPGDFITLAPWFNVIRAIRSKATTGGTATVRVMIVVDEHGKPIPLWNTVKVRRLYPSRSAQKVITQLLESLDES